ncbi:F-box protein [Phanerochaete sordida]|uniref:F-box protein n=1 Tax=Phanerochaete sordida TaxID=48140 RepID=A0A9P3GPA9_9APHY|nr:F-box protein [Phanerochaete sordida]
MSLPLEIITEIFGEVARDTHAAYTRNFRRNALRTDPEDPRPYSWIHVSHVCRLWRSIALSTSALWANLCIINPIATEEFLRRSAKHNLTVTFKRTPRSVRHPAQEERDARMRTFRDVMLNHIHRIASLVMPTCFVIFTPEMAAAAIQLRSITMVADDVDFGPRDTRSPLPLPFPVLEHFEFRVAAYRQRYIRLLCPTLKTLILQPELKNACLPSARELVHIIATMPHLEHLDVRLSSAPELITQTTDLPHLRYIRLVGAPAPVVASLLAHVIPARDVQLNIGCHLGYEENEGDFLSVPQIIVRALWNAVDPSSFAPCTAFSIGDIGGYYGLHGWRRKPNFSAFANLAAISAGADVRVTCAWEETYEDLATILRPFTLGAVQHVRIGKMPWHIAGMLENTSMLCSHKGLRSLVLDGVVVTLSLHLLAGTSARDITLMNTKFKPSNLANETHGACGSLCAVRSTTSDEPGCAADLAEVLARRAAEGRPVASLRIVLAMHLAVVDVEVLRGYVTEVEWDGHEADDPLDSAIYIE